nr:PREDICTED: S-linalool synthase-like [Musa acuminata subsp. malaccensis]
MDESISYLVERIKEEMFSPSADMLSFLPPSPYETAWVAMVAGPQSPHRPMFPQCLEWIIRHQREEGYWGELGNPMDSLTSTLACVVALNAWDTGHANIEKGLGFLRANMVKLLMEHRGGIPQWFSIVFPGMLELALAKGLPVLPDGGSMPAVNNVFNRRETILTMEKYSGNDRHPPLTSFLEALPISCRPNHEVILRLQMEDGSLFHSPSATACAFMITGDRNCLEYLQTMMKRCSNVVPSVFPVDEDLIKLCLVDHLRRLGCGEHFAEEIRGVMDHTYRYGIVWLLLRTATAVCCYCSLLKGAWKRPQQRKLPAAAVGREMATEMSQRPGDCRGYGLRGRSQQRKLRKLLHGGGVPSASGEAGRGEAAVQQHSGAALSSQMSLPFLAI